MSPTSKTKSTAKGAAKAAPAPAPSVSRFHVLRRPLHWLSAQREHWLDYTILLSVFAVMTIGTELLRTQYLPDSGHYLGMALWFSGVPQQDALQIALERHIANGYEPNTTIDQLFNWGLVQPRVVLPALAVPFIWVFGPNGLGVATAVITFVLTFATYKFLARHYGSPAAVVVSVLVMSSFAIMSFNLAMLTESLSAFWGLLTLWFAYAFQRDRRVGWIVGLVAVTMLSGFTRQATLIVAGAYFVAWLFSLRSPKRRRDWTLPMVAVVATSLAVQIIQTILFPFSQADQYMRMTGAHTLWGAILATPALVKKILVDELASYMLQDQVLVAFLVICAISMIVFWRRTETHLLLGALLAIALYNVTNGNATHFRYAIPGLIFFMVSASLLVAQLADRVIRNRVGSSNDLGTPIAASPHS